MNVTGNQAQRNGGYEQAAYSSFNKRSNNFGGSGRSANQAYLRRVENVHQDDIHCLAANGSEIISGSKDGTCKVWNAALECLNVFSKDFDGKIDYRYWITATKTLGDGGWVIGNRFGELCLCDADGNISSTGETTASHHASKARNFNRISCFGSIDDSEGVSKKILVGIAKTIQIWNREPLTFSGETQVSQNDWVYCIEHLAQNSYLVVIGSNLEKWKVVETNEDEQHFEKEAVLHQEIRKERSLRGGKEQRPFISAIDYLNEQTLGMVDFSGRVKLLDLETGKLVGNYQKHTGRAWSIKKCSPHTYATSADDATIKLWDIRQPYRYYSSLNGHPGRVSTLLPYGEEKILAGSCPDNVKGAANKASFTIWDCRKTG